MHVLTQPTLGVRLAQLCPDVLAALQADGAPRACFELLGSSQAWHALSIGHSRHVQRCRILLNALDGNQALCLLANLASLVDAATVGHTHSSST